MEINQKIQEAIKTLQKQDLDKTISICSDILEKNKDNSIVYNIFGLALQKKKLFEESVENFKKAIQLDPNNFEIYNNLGISLKGIKDYDLSEEAYLKSLKINPNFIKALVNLSKLMAVKKQHSKAIELLLKAKEISDNLSKTHILNLLSEYSAVMGEFDQAKLYAEETLKFDKYNLYSIKLLSNLNDHEKNPSLINKMESMINSKNLTEKAFSFISFELAKAYEQKGVFNIAYKHFEIANKIKKKLTKSILPELPALKDDLVDCFENFDLSKSKKVYPDKKIIFIIGLPRSGTTLVEQIISCHSKVSAGGENGYLKDCVFKNFYKDNKLKKDTVYKDFFLKSNLISKQYLDRLNAIAKKDVITDKTLINFLYIGFIKIYFPNSKIVLVNRNKKSVFLSLFQTDFATSYNNWSYDKHDIINYMEIYYNVINFWKKLLPDDLYTIEYEKLIENPTFEIKSLINFCGLTWDSNCLSPEKNKKGIETASMLQARKPIYKSSLSKFNNYSMYFEDILKSLESKN